MYFILSGLVSIQIELPGGKLLRLRSIRGGATVGEMGLYLGASRTADAVVSQPGLVYCLSASSLKEMSEKDPEAASYLHEWVAKLLAERVTVSNRTIEALME
jgi:SulP family sulfate permease